jgi:23S rRNA (pseudouridine1915-N3)-methyltransferase
MIYCVFVGPFKGKGLQQLAEDYRRRLDKWWPVTVVEIREEPKEIARQLESRQKKGLLVSLDAAGESMDSARFTRWVTETPRDIHFLAWGADGPPKEAPIKGLKSLSLSPMTYSHEIARVLLMEQLYRAGAALRGHPYPR